MGRPLPSRVFLGVPPLVGTMGKAEAEHAAALIVRACQVLGDKWQGVSWPQIQGVIRADVENKIEPLASLTRNPFFDPRVHVLADLGFAQLSPGGVAELTDAGIDRLAKWVPPEVTP